MNSLSKRDQILARKAFEARQIKDFSHCHTAPSHATRKKAATTSSLPSLLGNNHTNNNNSDVSSVGSGPGRGGVSPIPRRAQTAVPKNSVSARNRKNDLLGKSLSTEAANLSKSLTKEALSKAKELSLRELTPRTSLRRMQATVVQNYKKKPVTDNSNLMNENRFMPKVTILKEHGISLRDQYAAKCEDIWGKLQLCQSGLDQAKREEEIQRDKAKKKYTREDIVRQIMMRKDYIKKERDYEAAQGWGSESEMLKKIASDEEFRVKLNHENQKLFAVHVREDMASNVRRRKQNMAQELEDGQIMIARALQMEAAEHAKREAKKQYEAERNKRVLLENEKDLEIKQKILEKQLAEDKEALRIAEIVANEVERRRKEALEKKHAKVISSTAYQIATVMEDEKNRRMDSMYNNLEATESSLGRQVQKSEAWARARASKGPNERALQAYWDGQVATRKKQLYEEQHAADHIFAEAARREKKSKADELKKLEAQKRARNLYRKRLDDQVKDINTRSMEDMFASMTPHEAKINALLMRTCKIKPPMY